MPLGGRSCKPTVTIAPILNTLQVNGTGYLPEISVSNFRAGNSAPGMSASKFMEEFVKDPNVICLFASGAARRGAVTNETPKVLPTRHQRELSPEY